MEQSGLEVRTSVLETKVDYLEERFDEQAEQLDSINEVMHDVKEHIAKQNGSLPRIEEYMKECASRLSAAELIATQRAIQSAETHAILKEKDNSFRERMRWVIKIGGFIIASGVGAAITYFLGG